MITLHQPLLYFLIIQRTKVFCYRWSLLLAQVDVQEAADEQQRDTSPGQNVAVPKVALGELPGVLQDVLVV